MNVRRHKDIVELLRRKCQHVYEMAKEVGLSPKTVKKFIRFNDCSVRTENKFFLWHEREVRNDETYEKYSEKFESSKPHKRNVLVIGDLHAPFVLDGALEFCKEVYDTHDITDIVFLGDVLDNHYSSYHESDPDGYGGKSELCLAIDTLGKWHETFPNAKVCVGNHDRMAQRKAYSGKVPKAWVKDYNDVLKTDTWDFKTHHEIGGFMFIHGEGQMAKSRAKDLKMSVVQGHLHSKFDSQYDDGLWSIQGGCLVDPKSYAMAYGKFGKRPKHGCVVINDILGVPCIKMYPMKEEIK